MIRRNQVIALALVTVAINGAYAWSAETVNRKREKNLSGEVASVTKTEVQVKVKTPKEETVKVPANDVASIEWTGEPPECKVARSDENGGRYQKAIDGYQKALQSNKASSASLAACRCMMVAWRASSTRNSGSIPAATAFSRSRRAQKP